MCCGFLGHGGGPVKIPDRALRIGGMAFDRLYSNIVFFSTLPFANAADTAQAQFDGLTYSLVFVVLTYALLFFMSRTGASHIAKRKGVLALACVMAVAGSAGLAYSTLAFVPTPVAGALVGFGSTLLFAAWLDVFSRQTVTSSLIEAGIAFAVSFAASFAFVLAGGTAFAIAMAACPVASFVALALLGGNVFDDATPRLIDKVGRHLEYRNAVYIFFFGCIMGVMRNYSASHVFGVQSIMLDAALFLSGLVVCIVVVIMARLADVSAARFLYRVSFVFMLIASVLLVSGREHIAIATPIAFVGMQCFTCCLIARAMLASWALGGSVWSRCIATFGVLYFGEFVGIASALIFVGTGISVMSYVLVLSSFLLVGYAFLFTEADFLLISKKVAPASLGIARKSFAGQQGDSVLLGNDCAPLCDDVCLEPQFDARGAVSSDAREMAATSKNTQDVEPAAAHVEASLEEICDRISAEFGLTPRESEILPSVARGRTIARIQDELFISASTVNTHIRHIYAKCGVANRQELLDFVDDRRNLR